MSVAQHGALKVALTGTTSVAAGAALALANPEGVDLIITRAILNVRTAAGGVSTVNIGVAANATTSSDTLHQTEDVNDATTCVDNLAQSNVARWGTTQFVTASLTGAAAPMEADLYLSYIRA